jgi:phosphatidylserine/phosphatidylglycerophosphate/cardiolipin synthase-like enzyme
MNLNDHQSHFENIREELANELKRARHTIFAAVAWLTDDYLLGILTKKASEGVSVQLIISGSDYNEKYRFRSLTDAGGEVYKVGGGDVLNDRFMHNKFCVIDFKKVVTGA